MTIGLPLALHQPNKHGRVYCGHKPPGQLALTRTTVGRTADNVAPSQAGKRRTPEL
jgi:hypothetical protein